MNLRALQVQLKLWQEHNFPGREAWQPLLSISEEVGELYHAYLKRNRRTQLRIRLEENHSAKIRDAVADIIVFLADFCNAEGIDLQEALEQTWTEVKQRDWQARREREETT